MIRITTNRPISHTIVDAGSTNKGARMNTRKDYLDGKCSHDEYYGEIVKEVGITYVNSSDLERYKKAYATDQHLNNIPLAEWDRKSAASQLTLFDAFKKRGDYWSLAGGVCVHKAAVKIACT